MAKAHYKTWKKEELQQAMLNNDSFLCKSMMKVYSSHRAEIEHYVDSEGHEKVNTVTHYVDGTGFNKIDADFMCGIAEQYKKTGSLSSRQMSAVRSIMPKYAAQIAKAANRASRAKYEKQKAMSEIETLKTKIAEMQSKVDELTKKYA